MRYGKPLGLLLLYVVVQGLALTLAFPFIRAGFQASANPGSVTSILPLLFAIILAPLFILLLARKAPHRLSVVRFLFVGAICFSLFVTLPPALSLFFPSPLGFSSGEYFDLTLYASLLISALSFFFLLIEPQWYVVDTIGTLAGASLTALLGILFGILPVLLFLTLLMIYDAVAVYGTHHMISLADVVGDMKLPILMVMPSEASFDYTQMGSLKEVRGEVAEHPEEREALFMGLGDAVIPGTLAVSSYVFLPTNPLISGLGANLLVAMGAMAGSLVGYAILMKVVAMGKPQAGLPFLNGGAIAGFFFTSLLVFHSLRGVSL